MKRPSERGTFGSWLVSERKQRGLTPTEVRDRLRQQRGFAMAHSTYAMIESGSRQPTEEQRAHLVAFFGTEPPAEPQPTDANTEVLRAIADQTEWLRKQWEATTALTAGINDLVGELRSAHTAIPAEAVTVFLRQLAAEGLLLVPDTTPKAVELPQPELDPKR